MDHNDLNRYLKEFNISQSELARRLGVQQATVNRWCTGKVPIKAKYVPMIEYLCQHCGLDDDVAIERDIELTQLNYDMLKKSANAVGLTPQQYLELLFNRFANLMWAQIIKDNDSSARVYGMPPDDDELTAAEEDSY